MSIYHRYIISNGESTSIEPLRQCLHEYDPCYDIDEDTVTFEGTECGIIIDVTERGDPIFDDDIELVARRASGEIVRKLDGSTCMVTMQVASTCDEKALDVLFEWLRVNKKGILAFEDGTFRIDS